MLLYCRTLSLQFCCIFVIRIISFLPILHEVPGGLYVAVVGHGSISVTLSNHSCVSLTLGMMRPKTGGDLSVVVLVVHLALSCLPNIVGRILYIGSIFGLQRDFSCHCNGLILAYPLGRMLLHIGAPLLVATRRL